MQCPKCGADQSEDSLFCTRCGTKLSKATAPSGAPEHPDEILVSSSSKEEEEKILRELKEALKGVQEPQPPSPTPKPPPPPPLPAKYWMVGAFAVLLLGVILVLFFTHKASKGSPPRQPAETPSESAVPPPAAPTVDTETRTTVGKIAAILEAVERYSRSKKSLPSSLSSLNKSYSDSKSLKDGWGQSIYYLVDLTNKTFVVRSPGPDGKRETPDDIAVSSDNAEAWLKDQDQLIREWRVANPNIYEQLTTLGPSQEDLKKQEAIRKTADEKKQRELELKEADQKQQTDEQKRQEEARIEEEKRRQAEARKQEEDLRQAKAREEELRRQAAQAIQFKDNFTDGLIQWDAPSSWEIVKDQDLSALRVQGLGLLKQGEGWDNYKMEFEVKINKESGGWVVRAQNTSNFYLFKLGSDKAKAIPKNSLVRYIFSSGKYLNSLKREDAPGAAGVIPLPFKVRNKDFYKVTVLVKGNTITHYVNGIEVDSWSDNTFDRGRFGFNASIIEMATIRSVSAGPVR
jgi:zinc ribbon protein